MKIFQRLLEATFVSQDRVQSQRDFSSRFKFFAIGFHGDRYLIQLVDLIISNCDYFVETGTNVGSTVAYVGRKYPDVECLSCEPDPQAFQEALNNTESLLNVHIYNETSQRFLKHIEQEYPHLSRENILFWLDAHGYGFEWPLREEIAFITANFQRAFVLIDDFKVPGWDCFGFDEYNGQVCSFEYIKSALNPGLEYRICYPNYKERTSAHHPLRGWGLIEFGHSEGLILPESLTDKVCFITKVLNDRENQNTIEAGIG